MIRNLFVSPLPRPFFTVLGTTERLKIDDLGVILGIGAICLAEFGKKDLTFKDFNSKIYCLQEAGV